MSTALMPGGRELTRWDGPTPEQIALAKRTVAKGATDDEFALFLHVCQRTGLDPFARQLYCIVRGMGERRKATIQTSIDGFRLIADRTGLYAGSDEPLYDSDSEAHPRWAKVTVYKLVGGQRCAFTATARWSEYAQSFNGNLSEMWQRMPYLMLGKCAEALALRKAFPQDLSGLYTHDEMQQAGGQSEVLDLSAQIEQTLAMLGKDPEAIADWWSEIEAKYATRTDAALLKTMLEILRKRLQKTAQIAPEATIPPQDDAEVVQKANVAPAPSQVPFWRDILIAHGTNPKLPTSLRERIAQVHADTYDSIGLELAGAVMDWVDQADKGAA